MARTKPSVRRQRADSHTTGRQAFLWSTYIWLMETLMEFFASIARSFTEIHFLSYEQRNFLDEYGPTMWDMLLCMPGIRLVQRSCRKLGGFTYDPNAKTPLLELPDELLLMIIDLLQPTCPHRVCCSDNQQRQTFASLARSNKRIRRIIAPLMYKDVAIVHGWSRSYRAITTISASPDIKPHLQTLKLALHSSVGTGWMPTTSLAPRLTMLLPLLSRLTTLHLDLPPGYARNLRADFTNESLYLPSVGCLVLGPYMDFVISHCPNVTSIASIDWSWMTHRYAGPEDARTHTAALIIAASFAENLRHFQLYESWESQHLRDVQDAMPQLESLAMLGRLSWEEPRQIMPILRTFNHLKHLALPRLARLNVGFHAVGGGCGNPYLGPGGKERLARDQRRWEKQTLDAARPVAALVFRHLDGLERLWIGDSVLFTPVYKADGTLRKVEFRYEER